MAKKWLFLFLALIVCLCACRKQDIPLPALKDTYYPKALSFLDTRNDSAYYYFNKFVSTSKDSLQVARAYNYMAVIQYEAGDYFGAQEILTQSLKYLDEKDEKHHGCLSSDYNELGLTYMKLKNYDAALPLYDLAFKYSENESAKRIYLNNKALTFNRKKDFVQALNLYRTILSQPIKSRKEYARTLSNMAITTWRTHPSYIAAPLLFKALAIRISEKDRWGQNASYDHLSAYYMFTRPDSALFYANRMYATAISLNSPDDRLEALQKLISLSSAQLSKQYFSAYQRLSDSVQSARNAAKNQFALIRYDTEKNKADNLKLQKDNTEKKYQLGKQRIMLYGAIVLLVTGLIWYRKRKQRIMLEAQHMVRENELKISKKVHDVVANGLYQVMQEVQYQNIRGELLVGKIDHLYRQSRNISYEIPRSMDGFHVRIDELLGSFVTDDTRVSSVRNEEALWEGVSDRVRTELEFVLQELMVNMSKHSQAHNVVVNFKRTEENIEIGYRDDGIGMAPDARQGNGMISTGNRIRTIGGSITFGSNDVGGLRVDIFFPIA